MPSESFIDFQGKRVVVTGASSGIGEAIAEQLIQCGARPILVGRNERKLEEVASRIGVPKDGVLVLDLNNPGSIQASVLELSRNGCIYGFCHSAGVVETRPLNSSSIDSLRRMLDVNLVSGIEMARSVCRRDVMEPEGGAVVFISSIYALIGVAGEINYSASKGALIAAARAMAVELARRRIRVNTVSPGFVKTAMTEGAFAKLSEKRRQDIEADHPLGVGSPGDVAKAVVFLLAPQNGWITGTNLVVDGGYTAR